MNVHLGEVIRLREVFVSRSSTVPKSFSFPFSGCYESPTETEITYTPYVNEARSQIPAETTGNNPDAC